MIWSYDTEDTHILHGQNPYLTWTEMGEKPSSLLSSVLTVKTPLRILPPATPPFKSSTSQPGLLTSNDRITETHVGITTSLQNVFK